MGNNGTRRRPLPPTRSGAPRSSRTLQRRGRSARRPSEQRKNRAASCRGNYPAARSSRRAASDAAVGSNRRSTRPYSRSTKIEVFRPQAGGACVGLDTTGTRGPSSPIIPAALADRAGKRCRARTGTRTVRASHAEKYAAPTSLSTMSDPRRHRGHSARTRRLPISLDEISRGRVGLGASRRCSRCWLRFQLKTSRLVSLRGPVCGVATRARSGTRSRLSRRADLSSRSRAREFVGTRTRTHSAQRAGMCMGRFVRRSSCGTWRSRCCSSSMNPCRTAGDVVDELDRKNGFLCSA